MRVDYYFSEATGLEVVERDTGLTIVFHNHYRSAHWSNFKRDRSCYEDSGSLCIQGARDDFYGLYGLIRDMVDRSADPGFERTDDARRMRSEAVELERRVLSMMGDCIRTELMTRDKRQGEAVPVPGDCSLYEPV
ncbi:hypothetical protein KY363_01270 [Candidatus Woesearchaeota archaeon]|nr:hypothetical protein [Candidatus Woesearchaeota archaeon]